MAEAAFGVYMITLALVCVSVWVCFKGIAWVVANGWRSMLGLVALRAEGVMEWQDCDRKDSADWDHADVEAIATLVRETVDCATPDGEEPDGDAVHFRLWRAELVCARSVRRRLKRMERSDR